MTRRPPRPDDDDGFSLVELLVVMVILGILAAIAVPVLVEQRGKAADTATRHDAAVLGRAVAAAWAAGAGVPSVTLTGGHWVVAGDDLGAATPGVVVAGASPASVDTTGWTEPAWCLTLTNPAGSRRDITFSAAGGLHDGTCASPTGA